MDEKKEKRVLSIELDENVKKVSITGLGDDETVVMKQELSEEELDQATGGMGIGTGVYNPNSCSSDACRANSQGQLCMKFAYCQGYNMQTGSCPTINCSPVWF
jgi:hypothetical protein